MIEIETSEGPMVWLMNYLADTFVKYLHQGAHAMLKHVFPFLVIVFAAYGSAAAETRNETFFSSTLDREVDYQVIVPGDYDARVEDGKRYPVLYLLHCAGCTKKNETFWGMADRDSIVDAMDIIVAAPNDGSGDGPYSFSWWLDSPVLEGYLFSTFVGGEFKNRIDSLYATLPEKRHTGIAGHSMGGYGALHNALEFPDTYGAAFSAQGLLSLPDHDDEFGLPRLLGNATENRENWVAADIISQAHRFKDAGIDLRFYSGPNGWFDEDNRKLDSALSELEVEHVYFTNDDGHYVTDEQLSAAMHWFDSLFTTSTHTAPGTVPRQGKNRSGNNKPIGRTSAAPSCFDILGKALHRGSLRRSGRNLVYFEHVDGRMYPAVSGIDFQ